MHKCTSPSNIKWKGLYFVKLTAYKQKLPSYCYEIKQNIQFSPFPITTEKLKHFWLDAAAQSMPYAYISMEVLANVSNVYCGHIVHFKMDSTANKIDLQYGCHLHDLHERAFSSLFSWLEKGK